MPASRPALRAIPGQACASLSMVVGVAARSEAYWAACWADALDVSLRLPVGSPELAAANERLSVIEVQWDAAKARLERALRSAEGRRWLEVCP